MLLLLSFIYFCLVLLRSRNFILSISLVSLATLPFAKGKSLVIELIPKELVIKNPLFDIVYYHHFYLSDIFLYILIYYYFTRRQLFLTYSNPGYYLLLVFCILSVIPGIIGTFTEIALLSVLDLLKLLLAMVIISNLKYKNQLRKSLPMVIAAFTIFQGIWVFLQRVKGSPLGLDLEVNSLAFSAFENRDIYRTAGTFYEPSIMGTFMLMSGGLLIFRLITSVKSVTERIIYSLAVFFCFTSVLFSASRGLWGLYILHLIIVYTFIPRGSKQQLKNLLKKLVIPIAAVIIFSLPLVTARINTAYLLFNAQGSATYRLQLNEYALRLANRHFFGTGLNLSPYYLGTSFIDDQYIFDATRPHNLFFQILAEAGYVGLIIFLLFLYFAFKNCKQKEVTNSREYILAALTFLLCAQIYPIFINHTEVISFFFISLGLTFGSGVNSSSFKE